MTAPLDRGRAWSPGAEPALERSAGGGRRLVVAAALLAGIAVLGAGVMVGRREPPVPQVVVTVDRAASSVSFGAGAPRLAVALAATASGGPEGRPAVARVVGLQGAGLSDASPVPDGRVAVDLTCGAADLATHRAVVVQEGAAPGPTTAPLLTDGGSWRGLVEAVCWQQGLRSGVRADVEVVEARRGSRRVSVDVVVRNDTGDRLGLVLVVPPVRRAALVRPDGRLDGAEDDRTTWLDAGGAARLSRTLLVPCGDAALTRSELGLRFRRVVPDGERWDAPEPPLRGAGFVAVPLPSTTVGLVREAVSLATAGVPPASFCR